VTPPDAPHPAVALRRALSRLMRAMRHVRADHGVSASKLSVLGRLHRAEQPLTAVELARAERLQPQSLTRILADLAERGLIERRQDEGDRRALLIDITPTGRALLAEDARLQSAWLARAMQQRLTPTEASLLALAATLLDRLADDSG
jgi:DNA-binding MarR family transcriptional regulator